MNRKLGGEKKTTEADFQRSCDLDRLRVPQDVEQMRRALVVDINGNPALNREMAEERHGQVWDTQQMQEDFKPLSFAAPFIIVIRKADNVAGSLVFQHSPRFYFNFTPDTK